MTQPSNNSWDGLIISPEYDQPETEPDIFYMVCSIPRSGSSLFCDRLYHAGLGIPAEYWYAHLPTQRLITRWGATSAADYLTMLPARRSRNGMFGFKSHWHQYRTNQWVWGRPDLHWKNIRYIRVRRRDVERQAVSWWIAAATDYWNDVGRDPQPRGVPPARMENIEQMYQAIVAQTECWDNFLSHHDHYEVVFEDFMDDQLGAVQDVAGWLGVEVPVAFEGDPLIHRMQVPGSADILNAYREWRVANAE